MKKTIICNIPMKENVDQAVYRCDDRSLPVSDAAVRYPINAMLQGLVGPEDEVKVILLAKDSEYSFCRKHIEEFKDEFEAMLHPFMLQYELALLSTEFSQDLSVHEQLMSRILDEIAEDSEISADITYGPKDVPIVIFSALRFAEKFLGSQIEHIVYGQADFSDGRVVNTKICDMSPLYYLSSVSDSIRCDDPAKARVMLKTLLSL